MAESRGKRGAKTPRKITAQRLENMALYYLGRYASSSANLRRVLMRKVERAAAAHGADPAEGAKLIEVDLVSGGYQQRTVFASGATQFGFAPPGPLVHAA